MKKLIILCVCLLLTLTACSSGQQTSSQAEQAEQQESQLDAENAGEGESQPQESITANEQGDDIELTLPAFIVGDNPDTELSDEDRAFGFKSAAVNSDGSVTYTIGKADYDKLMGEMRDEIQGFIDEIGTEYESIVEASINSDLTQATLIVDRAAYEAGMDAFAAFGIYLQSAVYQAFNGVDPEEMTMTIHLQDVDTGEVFDTYSYPDDMMG